MERLRLQHYIDLHPLIIPNGDSFHIVMALPLIDHVLRYNVYKIISVPEPVVLGSLYVQYHTESNYIAISSDRNQVALISKPDFENCNSEIICTELTNIHLSQIYLKEESRINENCEKTYT